MQMLPHRYPFLMVDRVIDIRGDEFGIGIKNVTINEPQFQGHFPGNPVFPGVLMIEGMAQTAGVLCIARDVVEPAQVGLLPHHRQGKFRKPVVPGDTVEYHMTQARRGARTCGGTVARRRSNGVDRRRSRCRRHDFRPMSGST